MLSIATSLTYIQFSPVISPDNLNRKGLSASEITQRVTSKVKSGSICLFHNAALHTPEALPSILTFSSPAEE